MKKKTFFEIDILKAFAALLVIFIHVISFYKDNTLNKVLYDMSHFGVGIFALVSGFLQANSTKTIKTWKEAGINLWKRFKRIVFPYYEYVFLYMSAMLITGQIEKLIEKISFKSIFETIFILKGIPGYDWIPRLFLFISIIIILTQLIKQLKNIKVKKTKTTLLNTPIEILFLRALKWKATNILPIIFIISLIWTLYSLFGKISVDFIYWGKFNNIFGWLVIYLTGYYLRKNYDWIKIHLTIILFAIITIATYCYLIYSGKNEDLIKNKYPPNMYFVAYNVFASVTTLMLAQTITLIKKMPTLVKKIISWLAKYSYEIFFYHLIFLYIIYKPLDVSIYLLYPMVLFSTLLLIWLISEFKILLKKKSDTIEKLNSKK